MRLKLIKLAGFKSFVEPTRIEFSADMTAVVGPNGCGKSNVIDAVRFLAPRPEFQHARAVGTAVDHVAEIDESALALGVVREAADGLEKNGQFGRTAMDIANGEHGLALEIERRRFPGGDVDREGHGPMVSLSRAALHRCRYPPLEFFLHRASARRSRG